MKYTLTDKERHRLDEQIVQAEKQTGAQFVLAVVERSDDYPEIPWKAFALGAALAGILVVAVNALWPLASATTAAFLACLMLLAAGSTFTLLCIFVPEFAKLFLDSKRAELETRQYAAALFLDRKISATTKRNGVLLLVSLFERQAVLLADTGLGLSQDARQKIITQLVPHLAGDRIAEALTCGLTMLTQAIITPSATNGAVPELPNEIIEEKGA